MKPCCCVESRGTTERQHSLEMPPLRRFGPWEYLFVNIANDQRRVRDVGVWESCDGVRCVRVHLEFVQGSDEGYVGPTEELRVCVKLNKG